MPLITLKDIELSFGSNQIFHGFDLEISEGSKILIKGTSGSGKTSLLKLILGFLRPSKGNIYYKNEVIDENNIWEIRKSFAYVTQDMPLGNGLVKDFFNDIFSYQANKSKEGWKNKAQRLFKEFRLNSGVWNSNVEELSGGEQQRIAIIAAIVLERPVYLLDEITSSLDHKLKTIVADYFMKLQDKTIIVVTHDTMWDGYETEIVNLDI